MPPLTEDEKRKVEEDLLQNPDLPEDQRRRIKRRASNRESARRTRQKRTESLSHYQERAKYLSAENDKIVGQISELEKLYFEAVLQNRQLKGDIQIIRAGKPHLNQLCPPTVTSSAIATLSAQPLSESLYGGSLPTSVAAGQLPPGVAEAGAVALASAAPPAGAEHVLPAGISLEDFIGQAGASAAAQQPAPGPIAAASMPAPSVPFAVPPAPVPRFPPSLPVNNPQEMQDYLAARLKPDPPSDTATNLTGMLEHQALAAQPNYAATNLLGIMPAQSQPQPHLMQDLQTAINASQQQQQQQQQQQAQPQHQQAQTQIPGFPMLPPDNFQEVSQSRLDPHSIPMPPAAPPQISPAGGAPPGVPEHVPSAGTDATSGGPSAAPPQPQDLPLPEAAQHDS